MKNFAKLFDTPHGQLLVTQEAYDDDADAAQPYPLELRGEGNSFCEARLIYRYPNTDERQQAFDEVDQAIAEEMAAMLAGQVAAIFPPKD